MNVLGWKWVGQDVTIDMLKTESIRLLKDAAKLRLVNLLLHSKRIIDYRIKIMILKNRKVLINKM